VTSIARGGPGGPGAQNYVRGALEAVMAGQPIRTPVTRAYSCTVKYS
jgi:hypothetical protein